MWQYHDVRNVGQPELFADFLRRKVDPTGTTAKTSIAALVHLQARIGMAAARRAVDGVRVSAETADRLAEWAMTVYGVEIDRLALMRAPTLTEWRRKKAPATKR